jgi:protein-tyrosine-phosphatase
MKLKVAFVCVHNSCRSQMAEAWAKKLGADIFEVYSAGTENYHEVKPLAVAVMEEVGMDMSEHRPKLLSEIPEELDVLITMGCNVVCPFVSNRHSEDWGLTDPSGGPIEDYRVTRELIKEKVLNLIERIENEEIDILKGVFKNEI